jgi:hypothetical protein
VSISLFSRSISLVLLGCLGGTPIIPILSRSGILFPPLVLWCLLFLLFFSLGSFGSRSLVVPLLAFTIPRLWSHRFGCHALGTLTLNRPTLSAVLVLPGLSASLIPCLDVCLSWVSCTLAFGVKSMSFGLQDGNGYSAECLVYFHDFVLVLLLPILFLVLISMFTLLKSHLL